MTDATRNILFQSAFEFAAIGMALVAPDGRFLRVNRSVSNITGYSERELLQLRFQDITHCDDLNLDLDYIARMLRGELNTYQMEKRYLHKNGSVVWVLLSVSLVRKNETPLFFISQIQDITSRKENERALSEATRQIDRLRGALRTMCGSRKQVQIGDRCVALEELLGEHVQPKATIRPDGAWV